MSRKEREKGRNGRREGTEGNGMCWTVVESWCQLSPEKEWRKGKEGWTADGEGAIFKVFCSCCASPLPPRFVQALSDMPPRREEELDAVTLHNQSLMQVSPLRFYPSKFSSFFSPPFLSSLLCYPLVVHYTPAFDAGGVLSLDFPLLGSPSLSFLMARLPPAPPSFLFS